MHETVLVDDHNFWGTWAQPLNGWSTTERRRTPSIAKSESKATVRTVRLGTFVTNKVPNFYRLLKIGCKRNFKPKTPELNFKYSPDIVALNIYMIYQNKDLCQNYLLIFGLWPIFYL